jgi:FixJ family two-component response regulator
MPRGRAKPPFVLIGDEREALQGRVRRPTTAQALARRARIVLKYAAGSANQVVACEIAVSRLTVGRRRQRFV